MKKNIPELYIRPSFELVLKANKKILYAHVEDNPPANAFCKKLSRPLVVGFSAGAFEKAGLLPWNLPTSDAEIAVRPGDILLEEGNKIILSFAEGNRIATRIAHLGKETKEELISAFGAGDVQIEFSLEWGE